LFLAFQKNKERNNNTSSKIALQANPRILF